MVSRVPSDGRGHLGRSRCRRAGGTDRRAGEGRCRCAARRVCRYHLGGLPSVALLDADGEFIRGATFLTVAELHGFLDGAIGGLARGAPAGEARDAGAGGAGRSGRRGRGAARQARGSRARRVRRGAEAARGRGGHAPAAALAGHARGRARAHRARVDRRGAGIPRRSARRGRVPLRRGSGLERGAYREAGARPGADSRGSCSRPARRFPSRATWWPRAVSSRMRVIGWPIGTGACSRASPPIPSTMRGHQETAWRPVVVRPPCGTSPAAPEPLPAVDTRRFADGSAAMIAASALALAVTHEDLGFSPEYRAGAGTGALPHRLDEPGGVRGLLRDHALGLTAALAEYRLTGDRATLEWGERVAAFAIEQLWDEEASAFRAEPTAGHGEVALPPMLPLLGNGEMARRARGSRRPHRTRGVRPICRARGRRARGPCGAVARGAGAGPCRAAARGPARRGRSRRGSWRSEDAGAGAGRGGRARPDRDRALDGDGRPRAHAVRARSLPAAARRSARSPRRR